ncbi:lipopolysaccharide biosynthesis protein [Mycolicibacterium sp. S2-37]|uniref:lipopolysaccharide biosynthesis protein n=1 Tax=Mycolicibacterium sp. S2-37 TaxID=2810297 RepID=UPI001A93CE6B|nr:lipopolysaccharide biosynthesis protein [Mycolicibacterium sp. S2-37]MBO0681410.1 lipopolysaccharide biosynthesis protein [Mycolicibacterium sp. S2-37]
MTSPDGSSLQGTAVRGGFAVIIGQVVRTLIQLAGLILLARLLTPVDFGLVAMVTSVIGITSVLSDFGLSMAIMRETDIPRTIRDGLFYINTLLAFTTAGCVWLSAPLIAAFYDEPRLEDVTRWLAAFVCISGLAPQFRAELARKHKFRALASVDPIAQGVALVAACVAAIRGAGYWAVVIQQGVAAVVLIMVLALLSRYVPRSRPNLRGVKEHVSLGATSLGIDVTNYAAVYAAPAAVGQALGAAAVGLYNRAFQLVAFPLVQLAGPLTRVVVPILAHVEDGPKLVAAAKRVQLAMAYALLPFLAFIIVGGADLVDVLFGPDWRSSGRIAQILAAGGVFQIFGYVNYWLYTRRGRLGLLWLLDASVWIPITALYFVFNAEGAEWIAALYAASLVLNWLVSTLIGLPRMGLPAWEFLRPSLRRLVYLLPVVAAGLIVSEILAHRGWSAGGTLATATASSLAVVAVLVLVPGFRGESREFLGIFASLRRRGV